MAGLVLYRVTNYAGELVLETSRATEAFIKARQTSGKLVEYCYNCRMLLTPTHYCPEVV